MSRPAVAWAKPSPYDIAVLHHICSHLCTASENIDSLFLSSHYNHATASHLDNFFAVWLDLDEDDEDEKEKKMCVECEKEEADRYCHQCDDNYCNKCFLEMHKTGGCWVCTPPLGFSTKHVFLYLVNFKAHFNTIVMRAQCAVQNSWK